MTERSRLRTNRREGYLLDSWYPSPARRESIADWIDRRGFLWSVHWVLVFEIFSGALRFYTGSGVLSFVPYIGKLVPLVMLIIAALHGRGNGLASVFLGALLALIIGGLAGSTRAQLGFGIWILLPMFFGLAFRAPVRITRFDLVLWWLMLACIAAGIAMDIRTTVPWKGFEYELAGQQIEANRQWETAVYAEDRIGGFSRMSASCAMQIAVLFSLLAGSLKGRPLRILLVSAIASYLAILTTSKTALPAILVCTVAALLPSQVYRIQWWVLGVGVLLPLVAMSTDLSSLFQSQEWYFYAMTMISRFEETWPNLITSMMLKGQIFGAGFGGIGSGQQLSEIESPYAVLYTDSGFMYALGVLGIIAIPLWLILFQQVTRRARSMCAPFGLEIAILATFVYSITADIEENSVTALFLGLALNVSMHTRGQTAARH